MCKKYCDLSARQGASRAVLSSSKKEVLSASAQKEGSFFPSANNQRSRWQKRMLLTFVIDRLKED